jgi:hypothetical protein
LSHHARPRHSDRPGQDQASQIVGRGHGLSRRLAPLIDSEWSLWLPILAYAIEGRNGVALFRR